MSILFSYRYEPEYTQHVAASGRRSVNVWGVITHRGLGPVVRINGSLTAAAYADILEQVLIPFILDGPFPDGCFIFQHDRSPIHTSRYTYMPPAQKD